MSVSRLLVARPTVTTTSLQRAQPALRDTSEQAVLETQQRHDAAIRGTKTQPDTRTKEQVSSLTDELASLRGRPQALSAAIDKERRERLSWEQSMRKDMQRLSQPITAMRKEVGLLDWVHAARARETEWESDESARCCTTD